MLLRPLNDNIIIEPDEQEITDPNPDIARIVKEGVIKIPENAEYAFKKVSQTGKIVSWGSKCKYKYEVGQRIYFRQFGGTNIDFNGKKYRVMTEWELLGICEE